MSNKHKPGDSVGDINNSGFLGTGEELMATNKGYVIEWMHVPTGKIVKFKAMLTGFSDSFAANWNTEEVYGRMDPMQTYSSTTRSISLGWMVVASSIQEARQNMEKFALLSSMLYPSYDTNKDARFGGATSIAAAPLFKLKVVNLISSGPGGVQDAGLLGSCQGFDFSPDLELGFYDSPGELLPKMFELGCTFEVMHQHPLGWTNEGNKSTWRGGKGKEKWLYNQKMAETDSDNSKGGGTEERREAGAQEILGGGTS